MSSIVTRILNEVDHRPDILDCIANLSSDEVFTPPKMVDKVLDALPENVWSNPDLKWLDPATKTGVFLRQVTYRLMIGLKDKFPNEEERRQHIFQNMIYGISITELTALMARRSLYTSKNANSKESVAHFKNSNGNIDYENRIHTYINGNCKYCGNKETDSQLGGRSEDQERHAYKFIHLTAEEASKMKFDVIVGNPPYQLGTGAGGENRQRGAVPIYNKFVEQARKLNPRYMAFIIPARWYSGGLGLDKFRAEMLNDDSVKEIHDYPDAGDCFPGVQIKGGVMYFIRDSSYHGECSIYTYFGDDVQGPSVRPLLEEGNNIFIRYEEGVSILRKVKSRNEKSFANRVSQTKPFGIPTNYNGERDFSKVKTPVIIYDNKGRGYTERDNVKNNHDLIDVEKVFISTAGSGSDSFPHQILGKPFYGPAQSVSSETYLVITGIKNRVEADNLIKYIKTRFFRFLVLLHKPTQHAARGVYKFVPDLPLDQIWTDAKLYERYEITPVEQKFIESMIKEMN